MLSLPQPTIANPPEGPPLLPFDERSEVVITLLHFVYSSESSDLLFWFPEWHGKNYFTRSKFVATFWEFEEIYRAADKYDMPRVIVSITKLLGSEKVINLVPFDC
jgi:hypothetical protein